MNTLRRFLRTFDLLIGQLIALFIGVVGGSLVYVSIGGWGETVGLVFLAIGVALLLLAGIMIYRRATLFSVLDVFIVPFWWN